MDDPTIPPGQGQQEDATNPPQSVGDDPTLPPTQATSSSAEPSVGDQVRHFGDYELLEEIARGEGTDSYDGKRSLGTDWNTSRY